MEDDKTKWSNVIVGPWATKPKPLKGGKTREEIVSEEMEVVDGLTESVMVNLNHTLKQNDVKITSKEFIRDVGFMSEVLKSLLFREVKVDTPTILIGPETFLTAFRAAKPDEMWTVR